MRIVYLTGKRRSMVDLPKALLRDKAVISPVGLATGWTTGKTLFLRVEGTA